MYLNGMNVFVSPLTKSEVQVKRHKRNKRINKKWLKRYGTKTVDNAIVTPQCIYVSESVYSQLKAATTLRELL